MSGREPGEFISGVSCRFRLGCRVACVDVDVVRGIVECDP